MQELFEQLIDYLKGIWIKRRFIIISTWLICPISWLFIAQLDDIYESDARVYADTQSILGPLLKGLTVETNPEVQIRLMIKTLLSRPNLERITRMTDMDIQATTPKEYEELIEGLKENIIIKKTGGRRENIFTISYENKEPELAKNVVQSALTVFIENTLGESRSDTDSAQKFLDSQIKEYENRLLTAEAKLTEFKQKYSDILPNQYGGYYKKLTIAKEQLKGIELALLEAKTRLESAKKQLKSETPNVDAQQNKIVTDSTVQTAYDQRIQELEASLDSLQLRYTDRHPDVVEVKRRIDQLNKLRTKELENYYASSSNEENGVTTLSQNPVIQELQIQINQLENQVASMNVRAENYRNQVKDLEGKIHILPEIEAELVALNRGYDITKEKYEQLLNRQETAQIAQQADENTNKIQFKVIDPPRAATEPTGPKRVLFILLSTFVAFGVGIGLSFLVSQITPVATSSRQITATTGIPVFGIVSASEHLGLQKWHRRKRIIFILSNTFLFMLLIAFLTYAIFPEQIKTQIKGLLY